MLHVKQEKLLCVCVCVCPQVDTILQLWPLALQHTPLLLELLRLLSNTLPHCFQARLAAATLPGPTCSPVCAAPATTCLLALLLGQQGLHLQQQGTTAAAEGGGSSGGSSAFALAAATPAVVQAAAAALLGYASSEDGAASLVKPGASCLPELAKAVRAAVVSARRESDAQQQRQQQQQQQQQRQQQLTAVRLTGVLQLLCVLSGRAEGQRALLRPTVGPVVLELLVEVLLLPQQPAAAAAALLLTRNLCFSQEVRSAVLANGALLPLLLVAAESLQVLLPAAERQQWQRRLVAATSDTNITAPPDLGCDCRPPQWAPLYGKPTGLLTGTGGAGGGAAAAAGGTSTAVGSSGAVGAGLGAAAARLAGSGSSSRPGSPATGGGVVGAGGGVSVPSTAGNVCAAVYGVSALWALVHNGERVKAALKKMPAAAARLTAVKLQAGQLLELLRQQQGRLEGHTGPQGEQQGALQLADGGGSGVFGAAAGVLGGSSSKLAPQQQQQHQGLGAVVSSSGGGAVMCGSGLPGVVATAEESCGLQQGFVLPGGSRVVVLPGSLYGPHHVGWWLQQLQDSCGALLDLMDRC